MTAPGAFDRATVARPHGDFSVSQLRGSNIDLPFPRRCPTMAAARLPYSFGIWDIDDAAMRLLLVFAVAGFVVSGCTFDPHPVPSNAVSAEQRSVALLRPLCSDIAWNSDGHVSSISLVGDAITDEHVIALRDFGQLEELQLLSWSITDESMKLVASLPKLTAVDVQFTKLTDRGIQHLSSSRSLELVVLTGTLLTDEGLSSLAQIPTLTRVCVERTSITDDGVAEFAKQRPKCWVQRDNGRSNQPR